VKELAVAQNRTEARVEELAVAQNRTEARVEELAVAQKELTEAQKESANRLTRVETVVEELAVAQKRTEVKVGELADDIKILTGSLDKTRKEVGGLSRSVSYSFENEAYRMLPEILKRDYGIDLRDKIIRAEIGGEEINLFCRAEKDGRGIIVVGEAKLKCIDRKRKKIFEALYEKIKAVRKEYPSEEIVKVLITHYATKRFLQKAKDEGIIVIQSFEW